MASIKRKVKVAIGKAKRTIVGSRRDIVYDVDWLESKTGKKGFTRVWAQNALQAVRRVRRKLGIRKIRETGAKSFSAKKLLL